MFRNAVQTKVTQGEIRGIVLAAELVGDASCLSLLAISVYDTKPAHF